MYKIGLKKSGKAGSLTIEGDFVVQHAGEFKEKVQNGLKRYERINLNFRNVERIDLSHLQLICSAYRTSAKLKRKFHIKEIPNIIDEALINTGLTNCGICETQKIGKCIFKQWREDE